MRATCFRTQRVNENSLRWRDWEPWCSLLKRLNEFSAGPTGPPTLQPLTQMWHSLGKNKMRNVPWPHEAQHSHRPNPRRLASSLHARVDISPHTPKSKPGERDGEERAGHSHTLRWAELPVLQKGVDRTQSPCFPRGACMFRESGEAGTSVSQVCISAHADDKHKTKTWFLISKPWDVNVQTEMYPSLRQTHSRQYPIKWLIVVSGWHMLSNGANQLGSEEE